MKIHPVLSIKRRKLRRHNWSGHAGYLLDDQRRLINRDRFNPAIFAGRDDRRGNADAAPGNHPSRLAVAAVYPEQRAGNLPALASSRESSRAGRESRRRRSAADPRRNNVP